MTDLQIYDDHGERYKRAFETWLGTYVLEHPTPLPPAWWRGLPWLMLPFGMIAIAGIALSALRTAPVFADIARAVVGAEMAAVEAALAVIVIEVTMVVIRYVMVVQDAADEKPLNLHAWMRGGFWLAFSVAIIANVYATVSHLPLLAEVKPYIDLAIAAVVGISAPILAFISGDVLASLWIRSEATRAELATAYQKALDEWSDSRDRRWSAQKANYGVRIQVEAPRMDTPAPAPELPSTSIHPSSNWMGNGRVVEAASGFTKTAGGKELVKRWLDQHQESVDWSSKQIAEGAGVRSPQTANEARKEWKSEVERNARPWQQVAQEAERHANES